MLFTVVCTDIAPPGANWDRAQLLLLPHPCKKKKERESERDRNERKKNLFGCTLPVNAGAASWLCSQPNTSPGKGSESRRREGGAGGPSGAGERNTEGPFSEEGPGPRPPSPPRGTILFLSAESRRGSVGTSTLTAGFIKQQTQSAQHSDQPLPFSTVL